MSLEIDNLIDQISHSTSSLSIEPYNEFIIYGAGNTGKDVHAILARHKKKTIAFLDIKAKEGSSYNEVPILNPNTSVLDEKKNESLVVVAIFNRDVNIEPVIELLRGLKFKNIITFVQFHKFFANEIGRKFWLGNISVLKAAKNQIDETDSLWEDEQSRTTFRSVLKYRITGDHNALTVPEGMVNQYFPKTLPLIQKPLRMIDGGAYNGDTIKYILKLGLKIHALGCFEPDLSNFEKLSIFVTNEFKNFEVSTALYPCAVWSRAEYLKFNSGALESSSVDENGKISVLGVSIDEVLPSFKPNFIKLDIEGAEVEALKGARKTIIENQPNLAICLYHSPEHLWEIPLLIKSWNPQYKFYLRLHADNGFELVLYAMPE